MTSLEERSHNELLHGHALVDGGNPEAAWNWDTPAGQVRARRRAELISEAAELSQGMRVLEVGCGTGLFTEHFSRSGAHILAVDISPELLEIAKQRGLNSELVEFRELRFEDSRLEGPFDAIIGSSVLHHLDVRPALQNMFGLVRSKGAIVFAEPNMLNPQVWLERNISLMRTITNTSPNEAAFVARNLRHELREIGFIGISIHNFDWLHPLTPRLMIGTVSILGSILERLPIVRSFSGSLLIRAERPG